MYPVLQYCQLLLGPVHSAPAGRRQDLRRQVRRGRVGAVRAEGAIPHRARAVLTTSSTDLVDGWMDGPLSLDRGWENTNNVHPPRERVRTMVQQQQQQQHVVIRCARAHTQLSVTEPPLEALERSDTYYRYRIAE